MYQNHLRMSLQAAALLGVVILSLGGCSVTKIAARQTALNVIKTLPAYDRETDLELAEHAIAANLKLLEGVLEISPVNVDLLVATSRTFSRYTYGFVEDRIEVAEQTGDLEERTRLVARAIDFYTRAGHYGLRALAQSRGSFPASVGHGPEQLAEELGNLKAEDVPALYWTAFAWGNLIKLQPENPERLFDLTVVTTLMQRVLDLDETYYYGSAHLFFGVYYSALPEMFGGGLVKAKGHFLRATEISNGRYLPAKFLLAKHYCAPAGDTVLLEATVKEILTAPSDLLPGQTLVNLITRRKAARWAGYANVQDWQSHQLSGTQSGQAGLLQSR